MKFYTQYDRPGLDICPLEEHPDEGLVERTGYLETEELVSQMILAGERLEAFRNAEYGPDEEVPEDAPAFRMMDNLDAELSMRDVDKRIRNNMAEAMERERLAAQAKLDAEKAAEAAVKKDGV